MTKQPINWSILPIDQFDTHSNTWDELNAKTFKSVLLRSSFYTQLLTVFGTGNEFLVIARLDETVVACGIICSVGKGSWQTFQPAQAPLGAWIFDSQAVVLESLTQTLQQSLPGLCLVLGISQLDPDHSERPNDAGSIRTLDYIETARVSTQGTFAEYWAARGRNLRQNMKRQRNRLDKESVETRLEIVCDADLMESCLQDYGDMESRGWKAGGGTAIHLDNEQGRFYLRLLQQNGITNNAMICRYFFNDQMVATDLCVYDENSIVILKTTHDETQKTTSPAFLMRQAYFEQFFDNKTSARIEFYGKLMDWHTKWSNEVRTMYHVNQYRWPLLAKILAR